MVSPWYSEPKLVLVMVRVVPEIDPWTEAPALKLVYQLVVVCEPELHG
jgi:hypothetical protein